MANDTNGTNDDAPALAADLSGPASRDATAPGDFDALAFLADDDGTEGDPDSIDDWKQSAFRRLKKLNLAFDEQDRRMRLIEVAAKPHKVPVRRKTPNTPKPPPTDPAKDQPKQPPDKTPQGPIGGPAD